MSRTTSFFSPLLIALAAGCVVDADDPHEIASTGAEITSAPCDDVSGTNVMRSLAITNRDVLASFSFRRVMDKIRSTSNVAASTSTLSLYQKWMATFGATASAGDCNDPNIDPNRYGLQCPRPDEARLATINPFASTAKLTFEPVALFNRFDLAPSSGAHCGEYRIVYALHAQPGAPFAGRAFVIFEAALANPSPSQGIDACLPVARFWQSLSNVTDTNVLAAKLERFYFTGGAVAGFAQPVVQAKSYGLHASGETPGVGQVRTNFFMGPEWHLREFKLRRTCTTTTDPETCALAFAHVPAAANPANELFRSSHPRSAAFHTAFPKQVKALAAADVPKIGMSTSPTFNELESVSQRTDVLYSTQADAPMRSAIQSQLTALGSRLTVNNILDRATTQTCAGCHQLSALKDIGGGKQWPDTLAFVHVDEGGLLSPALRNVFLPHRKRVLESFINARCGGAVAQSASSAEPVDEDTTVGGGAVGAAN